MDFGDFFVRARRVHDEMVSRGPWDTEAVEQRVRGFYKFNPSVVQLDEHAFELMREVDPGLPEWPEFLQLLEGSELRRLVVS
jgi:hypothetical protein